MSLSIIDNSGSPVSSATVVVEVDNITVWGGLTDSNGTASASILVKPDRDPGPMRVTATFSGISGPTGLLGDQTWTRVVVLAPTQLVLKLSLIHI